MLGHAAPRVVCIAELKVLSAPDSLHRLQLLLPHEGVELGQVGLEGVLLHPHISHPGLALV